jgi:hypothetical protein
VKYENMFPPNRLLVQFFLASLRDEKKNYGFVAFFGIEKEVKLLSSTTTTLFLQKV